VALGGLAVVLVAMMFILRPEPRQRDPETMCPEGGPSRVTAILVDTTDRVGPTSRADILGRLDELVSGSRPDEMMIVFETTPAAANVAAPRLTVCNPGNPDAANPLISSPELIRQRLEDGFRAPLARLFEELVDADEAAASPVMETIQAISVTVLARASYAGVPKRLILISDLMQHSEHLSLYRRPLDYGAFAGTTGAEAAQDFRPRMPSIFWKSVWTQTFGGVRNSSKESRLTKTYGVLRFVEIKPRCCPCSNDIPAVGKHIKIEV